MKSLSKFLATVILLAVIGFEIIQIIPTKPCTDPIPYTLSGFDTRFGVSREYFLAETASAAKIWNDAIGKEVFVYDAVGAKGQTFSGTLGNLFKKESPTLSLNLVYDDRQKITQINQVLDSDINNGRIEADRIKALYEGLEAEYKTRAAKYDSDAQKYKSGRGNSISYEALEAERVALNTMADQINLYIRQYNTIAKSINENIRDFNSNVGEEFEEGIYSPADNSIYIYQFRDTNELLRVLTHEFGHALGLDHNGGVESIMYETNKGKNLTLSVEDLIQLKTFCQI